MRRDSAAGRAAALSRPVSPPSAKSHLLHALVILASVVAMTFAPTVEAQEIEWIRQFGTPEYDQASEVAIDDSGVYVVGRTLGELPGQTSSGGQDAFVRKYDASGTEAWTRQFGSSGDENARALALDDSGVYVAGHVGEALPGQDPSEPGDDAFLRKYDHEGTELWTRQFNSSNEDLPASYVQAMGLAVDDSGVYVVGWTDGALPGQNHSGECCPPDVDAFVRKYDHAGREVWTRQFGPSGYHSARSVAVDASGVYVTGTTNSWKIPDAFVWKFDLTGADLWALAFGGIEEGDYPDGIASDGTAIYLVGSTWPYLPPPSADAWVHKYDPDGDLLWNRTISTPEDDSADGVAIDPSGVYVLGRSQGTLPNQTAPGGPFVRQYGPAGDEVWTQQYDLPAAMLGIDVWSSVLGLAGITPAALPGQSHQGGDDAFLIKVSGPDRPPVAVATADSRRVHMGESVRFNASGSTDDRGIVAYEWDFGDGTVAVGPVATHAYAVRRPFEATLTVRDASGQEASDRVIVEVVNRQPAANAGPDRIIVKNVLVTLDGGDSIDEDGDVLSYAWTQTAGPAVPLSDPDRANSSFTPRDSGSFVFELAVDDGHGGIAKDTVEIAAMNRGPAADAGPDRVVSKFAEVSLDGSASSDADEDSLAFVWSQLEGPTVDLIGSRTATASFVSAGIGVYRFVLTVTDMEGMTDSDSVQITAANRVPEILSFDPPEGTVRVSVGEPRTFSVQVSDPDGDALTYVWSVNGLEASHLGPSYEVGLSNPGTHTLKVTVMDGESAVSREWTVVVEDVSLTESGSFPWLESTIPVALLVVPILVVALVARFRRTRRL